MNGDILITGSSGLIGSAASLALKKHGYSVSPFDLKGNGSEYGDIRNIFELHERIINCQGVIHLAAISRVIDAQNNPEECWATNLVGTANVINSVLSVDKKVKPWVIYASSREVYGIPEITPVAESHKLRPVNVYGYAKLASEKLIKNLESYGVKGCILRFSNVYGSYADHKTRVIPAFCRAVIKRSPIIIEGKDNTFDFTYVEDVANGIVNAVERINNNNCINAYHLVSGVETSLSKLANIVFDVCGHDTKILYKSPRNFDVSNFYGDTSFVKNQLNWEHTTTLRAGIRRLVDEMKGNL